MHYRQLILALLCALLMSGGILAQSSSSRSTLQYHAVSNDDMSFYGTYQIIAVSPDQTIDLPEDLSTIISENRSETEEKLVKLDVDVWLRILSVIEINSEGFIPLLSETVVYDSNFSNEGSPKVVGPCTPAISNGTPGTATALTIGNDCLAGTTCGGGAPADPGGCVPGTWQCAFYEFEATATDMSVFVDYVSSNGCVFYSTVFDIDAFGDPSTELSCETSGIDKEHNLTGLTVTDTYIVQVCYKPSGNGCNNGGNDGSAEFCIVAMENDVACDDCDTPCGDALGYLADPTVAQVVADCGTTRFSPSLSGSTTHTYCNSFSTPISLTPVDVGFQVIVTSDCGGGPGPGGGGGNVTAFSWELYDAGPCGVTPIQTGDLSDLVFDNLPATSNYVYCYTFTVPSTCSHYQHCPYFVGAGVPLPIELLDFKAILQQDGTVLTNWTTAVEVDNDYFTVERSSDGDVFLPIGTISGVGYSSMDQHYSFLDRTPLPGWSYYRLRQTDFNGLSEVFEPVAVRLSEDNLDLSIASMEGGIYTFQAMSISDGKARIEVFNMLGERMHIEEIQLSPGVNRTAVDLNTLSSGVYTVRATMDGTSDHLTFLRN